MLSVSYGKISRMVHPPIVFMVPLESSLQGGGAQTLFYCIPTHCRNDIEFQSFYELKFRKLCFYSYFIILW